MLKIPPALKCLNSWRCLLAIKLPKTRMASVLGRLRWLPRTIESINYRHLDQPLPKKL